MRYRGFNCFVVGFGPSPIALQLEQILQRRHRARAGLHHVAYRVADVDATLEQLRAAGVPLIDEQPRIGIRKSRVAFLHPAGTASVLTEIVEPAPEAH